MLKIKSKTIKCPKCGYEYLPAEIFIAESFLGSPKYVVRKEDGSIDFYEGTPMDTHEEYCCDNCGANFNVDASITFECTMNEDLDFDSEYTSIVYNDRIKLEEPDKTE